MRVSGFKIDRGTCILRLRVPRRPQRLALTAHCSYKHHQSSVKAKPLPIPLPKATTTSTNQQQPGIFQRFTALAASLLLFNSTAAPVNAETLSFPIANDPELFTVQKTLLEAWTIISESFVDPSFNHVDWNGELAERLTDIATAPTPTAASEEIQTMVKKLGDPFTRWVPPEEYKKFRMSSDGELQGVGLLIASDPSSGRLVVLAPIKGSPADRAGIQPGDQVIKVDGASVEGMNGEEAAQYLRGQQGSSVWVEVARAKQKYGSANANTPHTATMRNTSTTGNSASTTRTISMRSSMRGNTGATTTSDTTTTNTTTKIPQQQSLSEVPGVPGSNRMEPEQLEYKRFRLRRERVELSPVFATAVHYDDHAFGYVRLVNFSQHAAQEMKSAIAQLQKDGAEAFILDLRNNPGGLVKSSLEIAGLWLDPTQHPTIFRVEDREARMGSEEGPQRVVLNGSSGAQTTAPLVVLVNNKSASASEILAGALKDNGRATVIGGQTFGKGKIQSVFELEDGSAVFVTVAKYRTPAGTEIDQIGVLPDRQCSPTSPGGPLSVPGIPVGPGADARVLEELSSDDCLLTAEALLEKNNLVESVARDILTGGLDGIPIPNA